MKDTQKIRNNKNNLRLANQIFKKFKRIEIKKKTLQSNQQSVILREVLKIFQDNGN